MREGSINQELFLQSIDKEKRNYIKTLDIMSDVVMEAREKVEKNPNITKEELEELLKTDKVDNLDQNEKQRLGNALENFLEQREVIDRYYEAYKDMPEDFFEKVFKKKALGEVRIVKNNWSIVILMGEQDIKQLGFNGIGGMYFSSHAENIHIPELKGFITLAFTDEVVQEDTPFKTKTIVKKRNEIKLNDTVKHELEHAFGKNYLRPIKEGVVGHRIDWDEAQRLTEQGYLNLSEEEKAKALDPIIYIFLESALHLYLVGDMHREKFVSENGVNKVVDAIKKSPWAGDFKKEDIDALLKDLRPKYREKFFKLKDALLEVSGNLSKDKIEALSWILPADRIERILYLIGKDPKEWEKEWKQKSENQDLQKRESVELQQEFGYGSL